MSFTEKLPRKRMAAAALLLNEHNELLIVKPIYREFWLFPGGVVESGESPRQACIREVNEELGLIVTAGKLLCVDYKVQQGTREEGMEFVFFGGVLAAEDIRRIQLQAAELAKARYVSLEEAIALLNPWSASRVPFVLRALRTGITVYLEDGREVG